MEELCESRLLHRYFFRAQCGAADAVGVIGLLNENELSLKAGRILGFVGILCTRGSGQGYAGCPRAPSGVLCGGSPRVGRRWRNGRLRWARHPCSEFNSWARRSGRRSGCGDPFVEGS